MKTLVLSDAQSGDMLALALEGKIRDLLGNAGNLAYYNVPELNLKKCVGCFTCWLKVPGYCMFRDESREINQHSSNCDILVIITKIRYGSYSSSIKNALDRSLPNLQPFYTLSNEKLRHVSRYSKKKQALIIAYGEDIPEAERQIFTQLVEQNAFHLYWEVPHIFFCQNPEDVEAIVLEERMD